MQNFQLQKVWIVIIAGVALWLLGNVLYKRQRQEGSPSLVSRFFGLVGIAAIGFGLYAGFLGPVRLGSITFEKLSFAPDAQKSNGEAYAYVRTNLKITSSPASGWRGSSKTSLAYTVINTGNRELASLMLSFRPEPGSGSSTLEISLHGPFPAGRTVTEVVTVPSTVNRSYFQHNLSVGFDHVTGARF